MFKNEFVMTNDLVPEYILAHWKCKKMTPAYVVLFGLLFAACIVVLIYDVVTGNLSRSDFGYIAIPLICCFVFYAQLNNDIRRERNRLVARGEGLKPICTTISKDGIEVISVTEPGPQKIKFQQIRKMVMTQNLYILALEKNTVLTLKKSCFTMGTDEAFMAFMKQKCKIIVK